jgi:hypothetical protein
MQPLKLSDDEMTALYRAAQPIAQDRHDEFLQAVADALGAEREIGPGVVFRVLRDTQRGFFDPPVDTTSTIRHGGYGLLTRRAPQLRHQLRHRPRVPHLTNW